MRQTAVLFSFFFLFSCMSFDKTDYDSLKEPQGKKRTERDVAYLKEISQFKDGSFQFISKQIKDMIQNYESMKEQLEKIEKKLDQSLSPSVVKKESFQTPADTNKIALIKKNKQKVFVSLSRIEDYTQLMAQILRGEYDISEQEKEKLLLSLKKQLDKKESLAVDKESSDSIEFIETDNTEDLDEDSLLEGAEDDFFYEGLEDNPEGEALDEKNTQETAPDKKQEELSNLISAKKHFKEQSYETAISEFQKYRNENPEGSHYPEATFYIGQSFEKLKMPIEAEVFFTEIVQSHPQSLWARRAKKLLKK